MLDFQWKEGVLILEALISGLQVGKNYHRNIKLKQYQQIADKWKLTVGKMLHFILTKHPCHNRLSHHFIRSLIFQNIIYRKVLKNMLQKLL